VRWLRCIPKNACHSAGGITNAPFESMKPKSPEIGREPLGRRLLACGDSQPGRLPWRDGRHGAGVNKSIMPPATRLRSCLHSLIEMLVSNKQQGAHGCMNSKSPFSNLALANGGTLGQSPDTCRGRCPETPPAPRCRCCLSIQTAVRRCCSAPGPAAHVAGQVHTSYALYVAMVTALALNR
jgi:hypothetical protein